METFEQVEAEKAMTDHQKTQKAFHGNRERLKAARLAREAEFNGRTVPDDNHSGFYTPTRRNSRTIPNTTTDTAMAQRGEIDLNSEDGRFAFRQWGMSISFRLRNNQIRQTQFPMGLPKENAPHMAAPAP